jgi:hypothetical protein
MRRRSGSVLVAVLLLAGCGSATAAPSGAGQGQLAAVRGARTESCDLPARRPAPPPGQALAGPARTDLTGGAATHGFALDGGKFTITPPPAGDVPKVSRTLAECEEQAALGTGGWPLSTELSGLAIGYGLVTVTPGLPVDATVAAGYPGMVTPAPASYQDRLAWVMVFRNVPFAFCGAETSSSPTSAPTPSAYTGYEYEVFLVDAATGGDALIYNEGAPHPCGSSGVTQPGLSIPIETISVPWRLDSRDPDGYSGRLTAYVPPCYGYSATAGVIPGTAGLVRVLAYGQVAPDCGAPRPVSIYLTAGDVFANLPAHLEHAQTGLYLTGTQPQGGSEPVPTGKLVTVNSFNKGQTITVHVGNVVVVQLVPFNPQDIPQVHCSDPAVLELLTAPQVRQPITEFRAARPGRATLSYPGWTVHIVVIPASSAAP